MLSRKVVTRRGRRLRGYFPSIKLGRMVAWESLLERDAILLLEFSRGVVSYQEQPALVHYADGLQLRDYYPDFEVVLSCGSVVHLEVKPADRLASPKVANQLRAVASHYAARHQDFRILTEQEIRREPRLTNLRTLAYVAGRSGHVLPSDADLQRHFPSGTRTFDDVASVLGRDVVLRLIAEGRFFCDLKQPLSGDLVLTTEQGANDAALYL